MSYHDNITDKQARLIDSSNVFFVGSVDPTFKEGPHGIGPLNVSPKGGLKLHILDRNTVAYLDFGGSGDETARHTLSESPVTVMVCSFEDAEAAIVRLYGSSRIVQKTDPTLPAALLEDLSGPTLMRPRQVFIIDVVKTQTSCGYGLPVMQFVRNRNKEDRGKNYWENKNE